MDLIRTQWPLVEGDEDDQAYMAVPFWLALGSVVLLAQRYIYHEFKSRRYDEGQTLPSGNVVSQNGGIVVFSFMVARILGSAALVCLSLPKAFEAAARTRHWGDVHNLDALFVYGSLFVVNLYAFSLAFAATTSSVWRKSLAGHCVLVLWSEICVYTYRNVWPLATYTKNPLDLAEGWVFWARMGALAFTAIFIPLFVPNVYTPFDPERPEKEPHPEQTASLISLCTYSYFDPIFKAANKVDHLPVSELPLLADYDRVEDVLKSLSPHLSVAKVRDGDYLLFAFLRCFGYQYFKGFLGTTMYAISHLAEPIAINRLLTVLESDGKAPTDVRPWVWILCMFIFPIFGSMGYQSCAVFMNRSLTNMESILTQMLFEFSMKVRVKADAPEKDSDSPSSEAARKASSSSFAAKLTNLITIDMSNLLVAREIFQFFWVTPVQIIGGSIFLYTLLGWSAFVGLGVMILSLPLPGWLAKISKDVQEEKMKKTDSRTQTVTESVNVLRMIKMFGWESKIQGRIDQKREEEIGLVLKRRQLELFIQIIIFTIPTVAMMSTFATATLVLNIELTAAKVFSSMILFDTIRIQLQSMNRLAGAIIQGKVSVDRLDKFFKETELLDAYTPSTSELPAVPTLDEGDFIGLRDASFTWTPAPENSDADTPSSYFKLKVPGKLRFLQGKINLIVGATGSGKTSLLMALLGEMHFVPTRSSSTFNLPRAGGVSFCVQESWVQNETIRENILFNTPYDEERYKKVLHQCALEQDLDLFDAGDLTEVGERGLTLSGGQKARLTLARAIYARSEIILLDDVLAALDVHTAVWVVKKCLKGDLVQGRTVLLVTHNIALASPVADLIVSVSADGTVTSRDHDLVGVLASDPALQAEFKHGEESIKSDEKVIDSQSEGKKDKKAAGKLIAAEEIHGGSGGWEPMKFFVKALGGDHLTTFLVLWLGGSILEMFLHSFNVWFLGYWSAQYEQVPPAYVEAVRYMLLYILLVLVRIVAYAAKETCYMLGMQNASRFIHKSLSQAIVGTTLRWLDETPVSRILQRMTLDMDTIDVRLMRSFNALETGILLMAVDLASAVMFVPLFTLPGLFIAIVATYIGRIYVKAQMSVRREMSKAKAPLLAHFSAAVTGLVSLRAYGAGPAHEIELKKRIDHYARLTRLYHDLNRWINIRIDILRGIFAASLAAYLTYGSNISAANVGFSLNRAVEFCQIMLDTVRVYNMFLIETNSLERVVAYTEVEQEPKPTERGKPPAAWPMSGDIKVENLFARYSKSGPVILQGLTFNVRAGERVGVVGRTGSGKSSLTLALLRCIFTEGSVYFDGLNTSEINLDALRSNITIIPQMPELLSGTLRYNLDPFEEYDDATLNNALRASGLHSSRTDGEESLLHLDSGIASGGHNVSVGQRQIIALARAILRSSKLLILDEATSAIDHATDAIIQNTLRRELGPDVTVITIAHRLQTIMDADRILVLDAGRIVEFASPTELLARTNGVFKRLVDKSSDRRDLYEVARRKAAS